MSKSTFEDALERLANVITKTRGGEISEIDHAVSDVAYWQDSRSIGPLLHLLDDNALYDEAMYSLIHAAEAFDDDIYVYEFLVALPKLSLRAPVWASVVLMRILNSDSARASLTIQVKDASREVKNSLSQMIELINAESPSFLAKTVGPLASTRL